jgi:hypothetical protein
MTILKGLALPADVGFPLTDLQAWYRYQGEGDLARVFDRMWVVRRQGLMAHPHGIEPPEGDWLSRPIINLLGMDMGQRAFTRWSADLYQPGSFWQPRFTGNHRIEDYVLVGGKPVWRYVVDCAVDLNGTPWAMRGYPAAVWDPIVLSWLGIFLGGFTGPVSVKVEQEVQTTRDPVTNAVIETARIDRVVGLHLRPNPAFLTFFGAPWVQAVSQLCQPGGTGWSYAGEGRPAKVISVRSPRDAGAMFEVDEPALRELDCELVELDVRGGESAQYLPNDPWTWRIGLVGDAEEAKAEAAAAKMAAAVKPVGGAQVARMRDARR